MRLCPTEMGTSFRVAGLRGHGYELHKNRAHCTDAWLVFTREEAAVTWTLAFQGQDGSKEEA